MSENLHLQGYKFVCLLLIVVVVAIRLHLAHIPFERDEGEYAYAGQLINQGIPPYQEVYNMKFPGVYYMFALSFRLFGERVEAPRYLVLLLQLTGAAFIFLLGRRVIQPSAGWMCAAIFMLFNLTLALQGPQANTEHFVVAFLLPALYFLYRGLEKNSATYMLVAGLFASTACLMKQHAIVFAIAGLVWILYARGKKSLLFILYYAWAGIIPVCVMLGYLWHAGVLQRFYFLTIQYAQAYASLAPYNSSLPVATPHHTGSGISALLVWFTIASIAGLFTDTNRKQERVFLILLLLASALAVCPGFYFRRHYFLMTLPVISLLFVYTANHWISYVRNGTRYWILNVYLLVSSIFFLWYQHETLFNMTPAQVVETEYPGTPFAISGQVADYIKRHSESTDRICQLGVEPQLFFLSQRRSASGYIYSYPLLENQPYANIMTQEFIDSAEHNKPAVLVYSSQSLFDKGYNYQSKIFTWFNQFKKQYHLVASCIPDDDMRLVKLDTVHPVDTLPLSIPQIRIYKRI